MKISAVVLSIFLLASTAEAAQPEIKERILNRAVTAVEVALNPGTVKCSRADYAAPFLKVLIPQLAGLTVFDHRNAGEGAPCVAAGACAPMGERNPAEILNDAHPTEIVSVEVTLKQILALDHANRTCSVYLQENVSAPIRGLDFAHERSAPIGERAYEDCL